MLVTRRRFIGVLSGIIAAPIVVREGLLMPVRGLLSPITVYPAPIIEFYNSTLIKLWARKLFEEALKENQLLARLA